jgi:hypothetical protein
MKNVRTNLGAQITNRRLLRALRGTFESASDFVLAGKLAVISYYDPELGPTAEKVLQMLSDNIEQESFLDELEMLQAQFKAFCDEHTNIIKGIGGDSDGE